MRLSPGGLAPGALPGPAALRDQDVGSFDLSIGKLAGFSEASIIPASKRQTRGRLDHPLRRCEACSGGPRASAPVPARRPSELHASPQLDHAVVGQAKEAGDAAGVA